MFPRSQSSKRPNETQRCIETTDFLEFKHCGKHLWLNKYIHLNQRQDKGQTNEPWMILLYNILKRRTEGVLLGLVCWIDYTIKVSSCSVSGPPGLFCVILSRSSFWQVKVVLCRGVKHQTSLRQFVISPHYTTGQMIHIVCSRMSSVVDLWRVRVAEGFEFYLDVNLCQIQLGVSWTRLFFFYVNQKWINDSVQWHEITHGRWVNSKAWLGGESWCSQQKSVTLKESRSICGLVRCVFPVRKLRDEKLCFTRITITLKLCYKNDKNKRHSRIGSSNSDSDACQRLCYAQLSIFMTVLAPLFQVECCYASPGRQ